jgi:hypothetical protein
MPHRSARLLTELFGYRLVQEEGNRFRFAPSGEGTIGYMDLVCLPDSHTGQVGAGSVHHIAFRVTEKDRLIAETLETRFPLYGVEDREFGIKNLEPIEVKKQSKMNTITFS